MKLFKREQDNYREKRLDQGPEGQPEMATRMTTSRTARGKKHDLWDLCCVVIRDCGHLVRFVFNIGDVLSVILVSSQQPSPM